MIFYIVCHYAAHHPLERRRSDDWGCAAGSMVAVAGGQDAELFCGRVCVSTLRPHLGWVGRDGSNDDWVLWSVADQRMYRATSVEPSKWMASDETRAECLHLGRLYVEANGIPEALSFITAALYLSLLYSRHGTDGQVGRTTQTLAAQLDDPRHQPTQKPDFSGA